MFMDITGIDLFDQNICMVCAEVRVTCSWLSLVLIYLIKMQVRWANKLSQIHMDITGIDLFDHLKMQVRWANKLESDVH